jgi:hypothetical protein
MTRDEIAAILARVLTWPQDRQEDVARMLLALEAELADVPSGEDEAELAEALAAVSREDFAALEDAEAPPGQGRE